MSTMSLDALKPEFLIERNICPIKKEYLRIEKRQDPPTEGAERPSKQDNRKPNKKQDKKRKNTPQVCNTFIGSGSCPYGDKCKYSHDYTALVADKQADLPGLCPFEARSDDPCPFGIACRWATKHRAVPPELLSALEAVQRERQAEAPQSEGAPSTAPALTIAGQVIEQEDPSIPPRDQRPLSLYCEPSASRTSAAAIRSEMNVAKDAMERLQRNRYDLSKSVQYLEGMGVRVKYKPKAPKEDKKKAAAPAPAPVAAAEATVEGGEEGGAKKLRLEDGTAAAVSAAIAAGDALVQGAVKGSVAIEGEATEAPYRETPLRPEEVKRIDFRGKTYLAPLTTNGNLPFRRLAVQLGCDITCSEMAMATNLLQGHRSEFALLKRHPSEKLFGVQVCGGFPDAMGQAAQILSETVECDFVDINSGCPIDLVCHRGGGSSLLKSPGKVESICRAMSGLLACPLTLKVRKGYELGNDTVHTWLPKVHDWGVAAVTVHGRTREQRYSKLADWDYIAQCAAVTKVPLVGNGDVFSFEEYNEHMAQGKLATVMIGRGALIKPWLFTEIKEQRHWDISASERLDLFKDYVRFGLDHWGSDSKGVENTRRFLLEMMSFTHRYVPLGLLDRVPFQKMNWRPPAHFGRSQLETWLASDRSEDWIALSELLLGPVPEGYQFTPKHKSNSYLVSERDLQGFLQGGGAGAAAVPEDEGEENG